jgi:hypothetical protein
LTDYGEDRRCDRNELPVTLAPQIRKEVLNLQRLVSRQTAIQSRGGAARAAPLILSSTLTSPQMATRVRSKPKVATGATTAKPATQRRRKAAAKWSAGVMRRSNALDLESGVFKKRSARQVAQSLKKSAEASKRRKSSPFRSAMSMLNFEINRGGKNLSTERRRVLTNAKSELRKVFHRPSA